MAESEGKLCYEKVKQRWDACLSVELFESLAADCHTAEHFVMRAAIKIADETSKAVCGKLIPTNDAREDDDEGTTIECSTLFSVSSPRPPTEEDEEIADFLDEKSLVTPRASRFSRPAPGLCDESPILPSPGYTSDSFDQTTEQDDTSTPIREREDIANRQAERGLTPTGVGRKRKVSQPSNEVIYQRHVPRTKAEKIAIPGLTCRECDGWLQQSLACARDEDERRKVVENGHRFCKHRQNTIIDKDGNVRDGRCKTPPDYWNMSFEVKNSLKYKAANKKK